jgi:hypothetical protein
MRYSPVEPNYFQNFPRLDGAGQFHAGRAASIFSNQNQNRRALFCKTRCNECRQHEYKRGRPSFVSYSIYKPATMDSNHHSSCESLDIDCEEMLRQQNDDSDDLAVSDPFGSVKR